MENFNQDPKISVIIPVYNAISFIDRTIRSVRKQTFNQLEIILIDDGSNDGTHEKCEYYESIDHRIKVIHQENKGVAEARNIGLANASCEYIGFIDNDDWIHPKYFEILYNYLSNSNHKIAMCHFNIINNESFEPIDNVEMYFKPTVISSKELIKTLFRGQDDSPCEWQKPYFMVWGKLYKREILKDINFKNIIGEDIEFNYHVYKRIKEAILIPNCLYLWIQHQNAQHKVQPGRKIQSHLECYYSLMKEIPNEAIEERAQARIRTFICLLSTKYNMKKYNNYKSYRPELINIIPLIYKNEYFPFLKDSLIPVYLKFFITLFYSFPLSYHIFRNIIAKFPKLLKCANL